MKIESSEGKGMQVLAWLLFIGRDVSFILMRKAMAFVQ